MGFKLQLIGSNHTIYWLRYARNFDINASGSFTDVADKQPILIPTYTRKRTRHGGVVWQYLGDYPYEDIQMFKKNARAMGSEQVINCTHNIAAMPDVSGGHFWPYM